MEDSTHGFTDNFLVVCEAMYVVFHSNFAAYIVYRRYKPCEFLEFVWTDCWGNKSSYVITSPANKANTCERRLSPKSSTKHRLQFLFFSCWSFFILCARCASCKHPATITQGWCEYTHITSILRALWLVCVLAASILHARFVPKIRMRKHSARTNVRLQYACCTLAACMLRTRSTQTASFFFCSRHVRHFHKGYRTWMKLNLMTFEYNVDRFYAQLGAFSIFTISHIREMKPGSNWIPWPMNLMLKDFTPNWALFLFSSIHMLEGWNLDQIESHDQWI